MSFFLEFYRNHPVQLEKRTGNQNSNQKLVEKWQLIERWSREKTENGGFELRVRFLRYGEGVVQRAVEVCEIVAERGRLNIWTDKSVTWLDEIGSEIC